MINCQRRSDKITKGTVVDRQHSGIQYSIVYGILYTVHGIEKKNLVYNRADIVPSGKYIVYGIEYMPFRIL